MQGILLVLEVFSDIYTSRVVNAFLIELLMHLNEAVLTTSTNDIRKYHFEILAFRYASLGAA